MTAGARALPQRLLDDVVRWRREIHRTPELGFEEIRTSALVERELRSAGIEVTRVAKTGVVGVLRGAQPGACLALRADMDALPLQERSGEPFSSEVANAMHACGHDAHTAMLLGAAVALAAQREALAGTIKFFFQPAEEWPGGAKPMIDAGVMQSPRVEAVIMLHVYPLLEAGAIGIRAGAASASCDDFDVTITGRGGHGASPHLSVDTIPIAAEIVNALQRISSREISPLDSVVVTVGTIRGGYRRNIIADSTTLGGTIRCLDESIRAGMPERVERIAAGICAAHRASYAIELERGYPAVHNDQQLVERVAAIAGTVPEIAAIVELREPSMGAEDFAYFAQAAPGCLIRLGVGFPGEPDPPRLHSPEFRLDEAALPTGVALLQALARSIPERPSR